MVRHQDAFQAGNPFPDSFYNTSVKFPPFRLDIPSLTMDSTSRYFPLFLLKQNKKILNEYIVSRLCYNGDFHAESEDTHWGEYVKVAFDYVSSAYPPPWDEDTERLVAFLFGIISHQVLVKYSSQPTLF